MESVSAKGGFEPASELTSKQVRSKIESYGFGLSAIRLLLNLLYNVHVQLYILQLYSVQGKLYILVYTLYIVFVQCTM